PLGIRELLIRNGVKTAGANVVVLGRSVIVGKLMALLFSLKGEGGDATVTMCHSRSRDLADHTRRADIIVAAMGVPRFLKAEMVRDGVVVVDVGINRVDDPSSPKGYRIVGDVDFEAVAPPCSCRTHSPHSVTGRRGMSFGEERIFAVGEINALVREMLEGEFGFVAIAGEVSNLRIPASGQLYFKLKDASAQIAAVCFRADARRLDFDLEDGAQVVARGNLTLYDAQGSYQLVARTLEPAGRGDLERALRLLIARLKEEGLFDPARKRPLPRYPKRLAVVTSPTGAAINDILSTVKRRFPCVEVLMVPVQVQGEAAPAQIVAALDAITALGNVDVVILGRGGGSIEDLSAFNDEAVARAIHRCGAPVISAVGHESDVTVADFVADVRAATPTMAAEIAVPECHEVRARIAGLERAAG